MDFNLTPDPAIVKAVERLDYRVTVGDVAAQAGLNVNLAERGLLVLAAAAGGQLQVAESGEVVYLFSKDFQDVLRNRFFRLQVKERLDQIWPVMFFLIRISFGIVLILLIVIAMLPIIMMSLSSRSNFRNTERIFGLISNDGLPGHSNYYSSHNSPSPRRRDQYRSLSDINFLEAVFSFLFGDGNPNADLEERRWQLIAIVIRNHQGAVIAEQIAPFLDDVGTGYDREYEQYMLSVLARFNGRPEVSPEGKIVYRFPDLQTTVTESLYKSVSDHLQEYHYGFSHARPEQIVAAVSLGAFLLALSIVINVALAGGLPSIGFVFMIGFRILFYSDSFVKTLAILSLGYSVAYLSIPVTRRVWIWWRNHKISERNGERQQRARLLKRADSTIAQKLAYAQRFAAETVIRDDDLIYTTERNLIDQESDRAAQIDAEWQKRLKSE